MKELLVSSDLVSASSFFKDSGAVMFLRATELTPFGTGKSVSDHIRLSVAANLKQTLESPRHTDAKHPLPRSDRMATQTAHFTPGRRFSAEALDTASLGVIVF